MHMQGLVMRPSLQMEQVGGFARHMAKAVLSGRGYELMDHEPAPPPEVA